MEFIQAVQIGQEGFLFPDPVRADLYLCPDCRRLALYECLEDRSLDSQLEEHRRQQKRLEDEAAELAAQAKEPPQVYAPEDGVVSAPKSRDDPWEGKRLFRRRKKPDWEK